MRNFESMEIFKNLRFLIWLCLLITLLLFSFVYPLIIPGDPGRWYQVPKGLPPSREYLFGTSYLGQNMLHIVPLALSNTMIISFTSGAVGVFVALIMAFLSSILTSKIFRTIFTYFIDIMCMIPGFPILMVILYAWRDKLSLPMVGVIFGLVSWAFSARNFKGLFDSLKTRLFIQTSYFSGFSIWGILLHDIMPYLLRYLIVNFVNITLWSIGQESMLSLFGVMKMETVTIGTTIYWALQYQALFLGIWWWPTFPVIFMILLILSLYKVVMWIDTYFFAKKLTLGE